MKTIKNQSEIKRVSDEEANRLVGTEGWRYCPKYQWKQLRKTNPVAPKKKRHGKR